MKEICMKYKTYPAVEPDGDFFVLLMLLVDGREEPEEEVISLIGLVADGQNARVRLAYIKVDLWNTGAIDGKLYTDTVVSTAIQDLGKTQDKWLHILFVAELRKRGFGFGLDLSLLLVLLSSRGWNSAGSTARRPRPSMSLSAVIRLDDFAVTLLAAAKRDSAH
jgi:hypothetical protein